MSGRTVGLFATCLIDLIRPQVGFSTASLIEAAGFEVKVPRMQTCCGQVLHNSGDLKGARKSALHFLAQFKDFDYVVAPSGSCTAMVKIHYPELLKDKSTDMKLALDIASHTYELTQFLATIPGLEIDAVFDGECTYHDSCSGIRELGIRNEPRQLLAKVAGLTLNECKESSACCGFGGTFCVKYPDISVRIAAEKAQNVKDTQAELLLGGDLGCLMNIAGTLSRSGSNIRVMHIAEVLAGHSGEAAIGQRL